MATSNHPPFGPRKPADARRFDEFEEENDPIFELARELRQQDPFESIFPARAPRVEPQQEEPAPRRAYVDPYDHGYEDRRREEPAPQASRFAAPGRRRIEDDDLEEEAAAYHPAERQDERAWSARQDDEDPYDDGVAEWNGRVDDHAAERHSTGHRAALHFGDSRDAQDESRSLADVFRGGFDPYAARNAAPAYAPQDDGHGGDGHDDQHDDDRHDAYEAAPAVRERSRHEEASLRAQQAAYARRRHEDDLDADDAGFEADEDDEDDHDGHHPHAMRPAKPARRRSFGLMAAAGLSVVAVGAIGFLTLTGSPPNEGAVKVVQADSAPTKVLSLSSPDAAQRVAAAPPNERFNRTPQEPVQPPPPSAQASAALQPKLVRTLAVRPDGTIISETQGQGVVQGQVAGLPDMSSAFVPGPAPKQPISPLPTAVGNWGVHVLAEPTEEQARTSFQALQQKFPNILKDKTPQQIQKVENGQKVAYRVRLGTPNRDAAINLCTNLKLKNIECMVTN